MSMIRGGEIRAAALLAAARGAVNPGVVIQNAKRYAHYIETGLDLNEVPVVVPPKEEPMPSRSKGPHSYGCAFLDSRGFCTCGADPDLMPVPKRRSTDAERCPECGCAVSDHTSNGCSAGGRGMHRCSCQLANGTCGKFGCTDHG